MAQLEEAIKSSNMGEITRLLDEDPALVHTYTGDGISIVSIAAVSSSTNSTELIKLFADRGANLNWRARTGMAPLHYAAAKGRADSIQALAEAGAKVDVVTSEHGLTPLHTAVVSGHTEAVRSLIGFDARLSKKSSDGFTALSYAKHHEFGSIISLLQQGLGQAETAVVKLTIRSGDITPKIELTFPDKCIYCGAESGEHIKVLTKPSGCKLTAMIPFCDEHMLLSDKIARGQGDPEDEIYDLSGGKPLETSYYSKTAGGFGWLIAVEGTHQDEAIPVSCEFTNFSYSHLFARANRGKLINPR